MKIKHLLFPTTRTWMLAITAAFALSSCTKNNYNGSVTPYVEDLRDSLGQYASTYYYWNTNLNSSGFNALSYPSTDTLDQEMAAIKNTSSQYLNQPLDQFSFMETANNYNNFLSGTSYYTGLSFAVDRNGYLRVAYAAQQSSAYGLGVRRGWRVDSINQVAFDINNRYAFNATLYGDVQYTASFTDTAGVQHNGLIITPTQIKDDEVTYSTTYVGNGKSIGYLVYNTFFTGDLNYSHPGLNNAFNSFVGNNITDLIVDFRYNGGLGWDTIARAMISAIAPSSVNGRNMYTELYNNDVANYFGNSVYTINQGGPGAAPALPLLNNVVFIVSPYTSGDAELVINSLLPYFPLSKITLVSLGQSYSSSSTAGKAFGGTVYTFPHENPTLAAYLLISEFKNALGNDVYAQGGFQPGVNNIIGTSNVYDGVEYNWGDQNEDGLAEALNYINTNTFASVGKKPLRLNSVNSSLIGKINQSLLFSKKQPHGGVLSAHLQSSGMHAKLMALVRLKHPLTLNKVK